MSRSGSDEDNNDRYNDLFDDEADEEDRPHSRRSDEAEEDNSLNQKEGDKGSGDEKKDKKPVKPKKDGPKRYLMINENMLCGSNGLEKLQGAFKDFEFGKKGHEKNDLDRILAKMEHWIHGLFPKHPFDQSLERIEVLGLKKRAVKNQIKKIRMGMSMNGPDVRASDVEDEDEENEREGHREGYEEDGHNENHSDEEEAEREMRMETASKIPKSNTLNDMDLDEFPDPSDVIPVGISAPVQESPMEDMEFPDPSDVISVISQEIPSKPAAIKAPEFELDPADEISDELLQLMEADCDFD